MRYIMRYYKTWQDAFIDFVKQYGHNYTDSYNLAVEFEDQLGKNIHGVYFLYLAGKQT